jgi:hypothetical protein
MKTFSLAVNAALFSVVLIGCAPKEQPAAPASASAQEGSAGPISVAPSPEQKAMGSFVGTGTLLGKKVTLEVELQDKGSLTWTEKSEGKEKLFTGRWRRESTDLLLLLTAKSETGSTNAVLEQEGKGWKIVRYGNDPLPESDRLVIESR